MWQEERQQKIRSLLAAYGQVSVDRIVDDCGVSRETIRRDLMELETAGELRRVRGGAVPVTKEDTAFGVRTTLRLQEKRAICATALRFLESGQTLFMDAGSTSTIMAETLAAPNGLTDLTVITNAVDVARHLASRAADPPRKMRVILLAGDVKLDPMETHGPATINDVQRYHADVAVLAPWGIDASMGAMNYFLHGAEIARAMVRNASQAMILADHSKVGLVSRAVFCEIPDIDRLIVDRRAQERPGFDALTASVPGLVVADG